VKFGDIAQNVAIRIDPAEADTDIYVGLSHLDPGSLHLREWGHPSDVKGQKLVFKKGDVIFGRRRAYQRKLAVAEFDGICSAHAMVVRAKPEAILPEFLPFFLQSDMFMDRAIEISVGSLSPTINWKTLRVQEFPLPPLKEQKRIAEILWAADEVVEKWLLAQKEILFLNNQFSGNLLKPSKQGNSINKLGDYIELISGQHIKAKDYKTDLPGVPYITGPADFPDGTILVSKYTTTPKVQCHKGDILVTCKGSGTGKSIEADQDYCISRQLMAVRPVGISPVLLKKILFALSSQLNREAKGLIPGISRGDILDKAIFIPSGQKLKSLEKQFVELDKSLLNAKKHLGHLLQLRRSLLDQYAIAGETHV